MIAPGLCVLKEVGRIRNSLYHRTALRGWRRVDPIKGLLLISGMPLADRDPATREQPRRRTSLYVLCLSAGLALAGGYWLYSHLHGSAVDEPKNVAEGAKAAPGQTAASGVAADSADARQAAAEEMARQARALYQRGLALEAKKEFAEARKAFEEAAKLGDAKALYRCGFYAERGIGGEVNGALAREYYEKAAEAGIADGYAAIARMYLQGNVVTADRQLVAQYIEKGLQAGSNEALFLKGVTTFDTDLVSAVDCISRAAEKGSVNAQQLMARLYRDGIGVPKDEQKALAWARLAAANGSADAQVDLASLLMSSKLFSTPAASNAAVGEAADNLLSAEAQNNVRATSMLLRAAMAKRPQTKEDILNVRQLAMQAFEQGEKTTAFGVALTYMFTREEDNAREWLAKGAEAKDWRCQYATELLKAGNNLNTALGLASKAKNEDYKSFLVEQKAKATPGIIQPAPISMPMPRFPQGLEAAGANGTVTVEFVVNTDGSTSDIKVVNATHPEMEKAVIAVATEWKFKPAVKDGKTVRARLRQPVYFKVPQ